MDALTVVEMLMYTAELELERLVQEHKSFEKAALDGLIDDMGLDACRMSAHSLTMSCMLQTRWWICGLWRRRISY